MIDAISNFIGFKHKKKAGLPDLGAARNVCAKPQAQDRDRRQVFSKMFRWRAPAGQASQPTSVDLVGSFTHWQKVPLLFDQTTKTWNTTLRDIESNRTHHYVILVDGKPVYDKTCDGLAVPQGSQEARWVIPTERGPRVMLLFGQTK